VIWSQYLPELAGGGCDGVTIRQVLQMRSASTMRSADFGNPGVAARNHELALVTNQIRFVDAAHDPAHPPGAVWEYKTLMPPCSLAGTRSHGSNLAAFAAQRLWEPLGAEQMRFIMDGPPGTGREFSGAGFNATLRDLGVGLMLNEGMAGTAGGSCQRHGCESTQPTGGPGPGYGYQWWCRTACLQALRTAEAVHPRRSRDPHGRRQEPAGLARRRKTTAFAA
jgi:hypothetical protein